MKINQFHRNKQIDEDSQEILPLTYKSKIKTMSQFYLQWFLPKYNKQ